MRKSSDLKAELDRSCNEIKISRKGIRCLVDYYIESLGWSESEAIGYAIGLFESGTIEKIKAIGENGKEI